MTLEEWLKLTQEGRVAAIAKEYGLLAVAADAGKHSFGIMSFPDKTQASKAKMALSTANSTGDIRQVNETLVGFFKTDPKLGTTPTAIGP